MNVTMPQAVLIGAALIGAALWFRPGNPTRYQIANFAQGAVVRINVETGVLELCGLVEPWAALATRDVQMLHDKGASAPKVNALEQRTMEAMRFTNCFILNYNEH